MKDGLVVNEANNRWFEPARRIPVRIELEGGMVAWPQHVRVGGKVHTVFPAKTQKQHVDTPTPSTGNNLVGAAIRASVLLGLSFWLYFSWRLLARAGHAIW